MEFSLYPNPANNNVIIKYLPAGNEEVQLRVFDLSGKSVFEKTIPNGHNLFQLESADWNAGLYFVEMRSGNHISSKKLLIEH